jgi:hypothetical protein
MVSLQSVAFQKVGAERARGDAGCAAECAVELGDRPRLADGRLWMAGLSNEEFSSKLRAVPYPFNAIDAGTSARSTTATIRPWTRSPVRVPAVMVGGQPMVAAYLCTPLVSSRLPRSRRVRRCEASRWLELGAGNRPLDMILYKKDGKDFLLMSNSSRGVMKIPAADIATASPITTPVGTPTGGIPYETVASMQGVERNRCTNRTRSS